MNVKIAIKVKGTTKDDIRDFIKMIREWELRTPRATIDGVLFDTDPEMSTAEAKEIFEGIFPEFERMMELPATKSQILRLGSRGITIGGKLVGTCDEMTLSIGEASEEDLKQLQEAHAISLVRINRG